MFDINEKFEHSLRVGDIVSLASNPELLMTVTTEPSPHSERVSLSYFDRNNKLQKMLLSEAALVKQNMEEVSQREPEAIPLLHVADRNVFGLWKYLSWFGQCVNPTTTDDPEVINGARTVYDFKKQFMHRTKVLNLLKIAKLHFKADAMVIVPGHTPQPNNLQILFGTIIHRHKEVEPRKYSHKKPLADHYSDSYSIDFMELNNAKRLLLVDDIYTSGATMNHFADALRREGFEVVCFALSIDYKLDFEIVTHFYTI